MAKHRDAVTRPAWPPSPSGWREPAGSNADLARLAWEFLRRNPDYRSDYARVRDGTLKALPRVWGLKRPVDPDAIDIDAASIWRAASRDRPISF